MRDGNDQPPGNLEGESYRELRLLEEVESTPELSQRHLAHKLGIALGVANLLVRNLVKKGYIRTRQVGWKRWVYVLTPAGVTRKVQLTMNYIERFHDHYRRVCALLREDLGGSHHGRRVSHSDLRHNRAGGADVPGPARDGGDKH